VGRAKRVEKADMLALLVTAASQSEKAVKTMFKNLESDDG